MAKVKLQKQIERKAKVFALLSDPNRLKILQFLIKKKSANVSDIAKVIQMSVACTSHHLQLLKDNQILEAKREGINIFYSLAADPLIKKLQSSILD
jgi:DNA-binding transcriptional ArsR family regulator